MLKGRTTVRLYDGISGRQVFEQRDENMVTNALARLFSLPASLNISGANVSSILYRLTPAYQRFLSGVLLLDGEVAQSADSVIAPAGIRDIGHAGSVYAGTSLKRGTLNENESCAITNGYRYVWDFATDRANGTTACICLTSQMGGNVGLSNTDDPLTTFTGLLAPDGDYFTGSAVPARSDLNGGSNRYLGSFAANKHLFAADTNGVLTLATVTVPSPSALSIFTATGLARQNVSQVLTTLTPTAGTSFCTAPHLFVTSDNLLFSGAMRDSTHLQIKTIDPLSAAVVSESEITLDTECRTYGFTAAYFGGKLYIPRASDYKLCVFSAAGAFERVIDITDTEYAYIFGGRLCYPGSGRLNFIDSEGVVTTANSINSARSGYQRLVPQHGLSLPLVCDSTYGYGVYTPYLATVNNLSSPITKANSQTMKVIYEITSD